MTVQPEKDHRAFWAKVKPRVFKTIIGSIVAAALVGVAAMIFGDFNKLSLTLILIIIVIISFTLLAWYDADVSSKRSHPFAVVGLSVSFALLLIGIGKVLFPHQYDYGVPDNPAYHEDYAANDFDPIWEGFGQWIGILFVARFALLHAHLLLNIHRKYTTPLLRVVAKVTIGLIALFALLLTLPLLFDQGEFSETYWRFAGAVFILDVLGTILIPISNALFRPRTPVGVTPQQMNQMTAAQIAQQAQWVQYPPVGPDHQWGAQTAPNPAPPLQTPQVFEQPPVGVPAAPVSPVQQPVGQVVFEQAPAVDRRLAWPRYVDGTPVPVNPDGTPNFDNVTRY